MGFLLVLPLDDCRERGGQERGENEEEQEPGSPETKTGNRILTSSGRGVAPPNPDPNVKWKTFDLESGKEDRRESGLISEPEGKRGQGPLPSDAGMYTVRSEVLESDEEDVHGAGCH